MCRIYKVLIIAVVAVLYGCSSAQVAPAPIYEEEVPDNEDYAVIQTFFATDRNLTGRTKPSQMFGANRSSISYGTSYVSIPRDHRMGELESPLIMRFELREDPAKHVVLLETTISDKDTFFKDIAARVSNSSKSSAFVFVHGYRVTFEDAARRTAQMSYDLGFDGAPVFYSWPSKGKYLDYFDDERSLKLSKENLKNFLDDFFVRSDAQNVYLIAHSMGNQGLTSAVISLLNEKPELRSRLKELILAAPDISADVFKQKIAPALAAIGRPVTLYASSKDLALIASREMRAKLSPSITVNESPRAGDSGKGLVVFRGIETIDVTHVDTSFIGHSYFAEKDSIISDMFCLIGNNLRAAQRFGLRSAYVEAGQYWEFKP